MDSQKKKKQKLVSSTVYIIFAANGTIIDKERESENYPPMKKKNALML